MPAPQRLRQPGVIRRLLDEPWRFSFAQALRLLLRWLAAQGVTHDEAYEHVLKFCNSLSLAFPASELAALEVTDRGADGGADAGAEFDAEPGVGGRAAPQLEIAITPAFIGLLGAAGVLPLHDTQHIADLPPGEQRDGVCAFIDLLSARMVALYSQAGELHRLEHGLSSGGEDGLLPLLLALSGAQPRPPHPYDHVAAYYAGLLRMRPVSAAAISQVLTGYFGVPVACVQFAGGWESVPPERRTVLGPSRQILGSGAMLGDRLFRPERGVRLDVGPLDAGQLERFLPDGDAASAMARLLRLCAVPALVFEVHLLAAPVAIGPLVLGPPSQRRRLGWDSFMPDRHGGVEKPEIRYLLKLEQEGD